MATKKRTRARAAVSTRAVVARINRRLPEGQELKGTRGGPRDLPARGRSPRGRRRHGGRGGARPRAQSAGGLGAHGGARMRGWVESRQTAAGEARYDAILRVDGTKRRAKTFGTRKAADDWLTRMVGEVHAGTFVDVQPTVMSDVFDRWVIHALEVRVREGSLKRSTAGAYRSVLAQHLRPAFGATAPTGSPSASSRRGAPGSPKRSRGDAGAEDLLNLRLLHAIVEWARHPERRYLAHDPFAGLPQMRLPRGKKRPHFEPAQVLGLLAWPPRHRPRHDRQGGLVQRAPSRRTLRLRWADLDGATVATAAGSTCAARSTRERSPRRRRRTRTASSTCRSSPRRPGSLPGSRTRRSARVHLPPGERAPAGSRRVAPRAPGADPRARRPPATARRAAFAPAHLCALLIAQGEDPATLPTRSATHRAAHPGPLRHVFNRVRVEAMRRLGGRNPIRQPSGRTGEHQEQAGRPRSENASRAGSYE